MSAHGNTRRTSESSRGGHDVASNEAWAQAQTIARARRGRTKIEERSTSRDDGTPHKAHERYVGRSHRGGPNRTEMDRLALDAVVRELVPGRAALLLADLSAPVPGSGARPTPEYRAARHAAFDRLRLASRLLAELLLGADRELLKVRDLSSRNGRELAALEVGTLIYCGTQGVKARHVRALRQQVEARSLLLIDAAPFFVEIRQRESEVAPCVACGGQIWCGRCRRCGTKPASMEID